MRLIIKIHISICILLWTYVWVYAQNNFVTRNEVFQYFAEIYKEDIPQSYMYMNVKYRGLERYPQLYRALQVLIYKNLIKNTPTTFYPDRGITLNEFSILSERILWIEIDFDIQDKDNLSVYDFEILKQHIKEMRVVQEWEYQSSTIIIPSSSSLGMKWDIFIDIYDTLRKKHYNAELFDRDQLMIWAINWLTESIWDVYTTYYPPTQSQNFFDWLDGEYEWIWAYVDLPEPWIFIIVTPMVWSPAETWWLRWGDRITHVDDKEITVDNSQSEIISWIKWPAWTTVDLTFFRPSTQETSTATITREKIILTEVEYKSLDSDTYYIQIKNFWEKVDNDFIKAMEEFISSWSWRLILDLRNNPGGYLWKVIHILSHFIETWDPVAVIKQWSDTIYYNAKDIKKYDIWDIEIFILQNSWTASASEIFIGTLQDYYPHIVTIGEKTFWKWSVQSLRQFYDGSTLRYTTAKWYTWKHKRAIDQVWLLPDREIEDTISDADDYILDEAMK